MIANNCDMSSYLTALIFLFFLVNTSCSKIGSPPTIFDPEFNGQWIGDGIEMSIGHDSGYLSAIGFNSNVDSSWDKQAFTGTVRGPGFAEGNIQIWDTRNRTEDVLIAMFELELSRTGDTITLDLEPLQENYQLQKQ